MSARKRFMETWTERHNRIVRDRIKQAKKAGNRGGTWTDQARHANRIQKQKKIEVQGRGSWTSQANKAARHRRQRAGQTRAWWQRL